MAWESRMISLIVGIALVVRFVSSGRARDAVALAYPIAKVEQATTLGTKRPVRISHPRTFIPASWAAHALGHRAL